MDRFVYAGAGIVLGVLLAPWTSCPPLLAGALMFGALGLRLAWRGAGWAEVLAGLGAGLLIVGTIPDGPRLRGPVVVVGVVTSAPTGREVDLALSRTATMGGVWRAAEGRVHVRLPGPLSLAPGDALVAVGVGREPWTSGPPGGPDGAVNARRVRVHTFVEASGARRLGGDPIPPDDAVHPLLRALVTGDRRSLSKEVQERFRATGTSHLLAVSGSNVALAAALTAAALRALRGLVALRRPAGVVAWPVGVAGLVGAVVFSVGVGLPTSVLRAMVAALLVGVGLLLGRRMEGWSLLLLVASLLLAWDPAVIGSPSFQLSFGAVGGLLGWGRTLQERVVAPAPRWLRPALAAFTISTAATIGTLPAAAWWFQAVPTSGPIANLVAVPWCGLFLVPAALVAVMAPEPLAGWANTLGGHGSDALIHLLGWFEWGVLRPAVGPFGALLLCGLLVLSRRPLVAVLLVAVVVGWPRRPPDTLRLTFPDVGQGSAALVEWPDGRRWLVDGGMPWAGTAAWLRRIRVRRLDVVVASHGDLDHVGGLTEVLETLEVGALHLAGTDGLEALREVAAAQGVPLVDDPFARLHPKDPFGLERNAASLVVVAEHGRARAVLPGDVPRSVERTLAPLVGDVDLLTLAHHGSRGSTDPAWVEALQPELAVVQLGRSNRYGHPHAEALQALGEVPTLRSDVHGTVEVRLGAAIRVAWTRAGGASGTLTLPSAWPTSAATAPAPR